MSAEVTTYDATEAKEIEKMEETVVEAPVAFWRPHRYDLFNEAGGMVASVYRTPDDQWCWFLSSQNVGGAKESLTDAMSAVESALKVRVVTATKAPPVAKDRDEAQSRLNRFLWETFGSAANAGAIGLVLGVTTFVQTGEGEGEQVKAEDLTLTFAKFPPVPVGQDIEAARTNLLAYQHAMTKLLREAMDKAETEVLGAVAAPAEEAAA